MNLIYSKSFSNLQEQMTKRQKELLDFITNQGISVKIVGRESNNFATDEELSKLQALRESILGSESEHYNNLMRDRKALQEKEEQLTRRFRF